VLVHHANSKALRGFWRTDFLPDAIDQNIACVGLMMTEKQAYPSGLPCSIFANDRVDRSSFNLDRNTIQRRQGTKSFFNAARFERDFA